MNNDQQVARTPEAPAEDRRVVPFPTVFARLKGWMAPVRGPGVAHMAVRNPTSAGWRLVSLCGAASSGPYRAVGHGRRSRRCCSRCLAALARLKVPAPQPPPGPASPPPGGRAA